MKTGSPLRKARMGYLFAVVLVLAGLVPVIYFLVLLGWQVSASIQADHWVALPLTLVFSAHSLALLPKFSWVAPPAVALVLDYVHVGLIPAVLGALLIALGVPRALREKALIRTYKQRNQDRVRRIDDYRRDESRIEPLDERREPYIGTGAFDRNADRRVA
jgi:hypothetical protein